MILIVSTFNTVVKVHKIRLNPTPEQEVYFRKACGTARFVYNWGLGEWNRHKADPPGEKYGVMAIKKDFNAIKREQYPWALEVAKDVAEGGFTNLASAFKNYYERKNGERQGRRVGFPQFKTRKGSRQSFRLNNDKLPVADHALYVPRLGWVNMAESLRFAGRSWVRWCPGQPENGTWRSRWKWTSRKEYLSPRDLSAWTSASRSWRC